jgi:hypothetical protein
MRASAEDARTTVSPLRHQASFQILLSALLIGVAAAIPYLRGFASASRPASSTVARLSAEVSVLAAGRGSPRVNFADGRDCVATVAGPAEITQAIEQNIARPLAMAAADFDEDGVADLVSGYANSDSGIITLHRGNLDSIYPNSPEARRHRAEGAFTPSPFLSPAQAFAVAVRADFLGAGDFDGDGHWDIVAAARGSASLYLLAGDGRGALSTGKRIELPGPITAMVTGEINRRDGLNDIAVAVDSEAGDAKLLIFEGPAGATSASPEVFDLPATAAALALGQLDDDYPMDVAAVAGSDLVILHGRDRFLTLDAKYRTITPEADVSRHLMPFQMKSLAVGDFGAGRGAEIALLTDDGAVHFVSREIKEKTEKWREVGKLKVSGSPHSLTAARVSPLSTDDLIVADAASRQLHIISQESGVRSQGSENQIASLDAEAPPVAVLPMRLNSDALSDFVILKAGRVAPTVIMSAAAATFTVINTNDSGPGSLRQAMLDAETSEGADAIVFNIPGAGPYTINLKTALPRPIQQPVTIDATTQPGFDGSPVVELNGELNGQNSNRNGFEIIAGRSVVRGFVINRFERNGILLYIGGGNIIEGNYIGTDLTGTLNRGNSSRGVATGITFGGDEGEPGSPNNLIGGTVAQARNLIAGSGSHGVRILGDNSTGNIVQGNFIGTDATGTAGINNRDEGVIVENRDNNLIGGTVAGAGNLISSNGGRGVAGVEIRGVGAKGNLLQGNLIGTNAAGTSPLSNLSDGVLIVLGATGNTIGGGTRAARNVISGNRAKGVVLALIPANATNVVEGNFIGTDRSGSARMGNGQTGVLVSDARNTFIRNNLISANLDHGVSIGGIFVDPDTDGISFGGQGSIVEGNFIGTDVEGTLDLGNGGNGVFVENKSLKHTIRSNRIAFNKKNGVCIPNEPSDSTVIPKDPGFQIMVTRNEIFSNLMLGIDIADPGVTPNDAGDTDDGANDGQNFPLLATAMGDLASTTVQGAFNSTPGSTFTIEFFSNPSAGQCMPQGQRFIGSITVRTDSSGNAPINITFPVPNAGGFVNATATDITGDINNTSEFSACVSRGPRVLSITVLSKITVVGAGFVEPVQVLIDGVAFQSPAQVKASGRRVIQKGKLLDGRSIEQAAPPGKRVVIKFINGDKGVTEVSFRN